MKTKKKNSFGKRVLSTVLAVATALSGFTFTGISPNTTITASAETAVDGDDIVSEAMKYLGYGYSQASRFGTNGTFDCSGFVYTVLNNLKVGVNNGSLPQTTDAWDTWFNNLAASTSAGTEYTGTYALTYNGTTMKTVVASTYAQYKQYCADSSYDDCAIVLTAETQEYTMVNDGLLSEPGTIIIHDGHAAIGIGNFTPDFTTAKQSDFYLAGYTDESTARTIAQYYNSLYYTRQMMEYINDNYGTSIAQSGVSITGLGTLSSALSNANNIISVYGFTVGGKTPSLSNTILSSGSSYSVVEQLTDGLYASRNYSNGLVANTTGGTTIGEQVNSVNGSGSNAWGMDHRYGCKRYCNTHRSCNRSI